MERPCLLQTTQTTHSTKEGATVQVSFQTFPKRNGWLNTELKLSQGSKQGTQTKLIYPTTPYSKDELKIAKTEKQNKKYKKNKKTIYARLFLQCLQDPPGVSLYTITGYLVKGGVTNTQGEVITGHYNLILCVLR